MLLNKKNIKQKKLIYILSNIFGINLSTSLGICKNKGINPTVNIEKLSRKKIESLEMYLRYHFLVNERLKKQLNTYKNNLVEIKSYRGLRNWVGLPVRGQRTHTNAKTKKKFRKKI